MASYKILITGASGFVGIRFLNEKFKAKNLELVFTSHSKIISDSINIDLVDEVQVKSLLKLVNPTHIFHLAALVTPFLNEHNKFSSYQKNFLITNNLVQNCSKSTKFYFTSTDKVYQSNQEKAKESDVYELPNTFYALMKLMCEDIITKSLESHFIFRCPIIHSNGDDTSTSFIDKAIIDLLDNKKVSAYSNIIRHYIIVTELVDFLLGILDSDQYGIYNIGSEPISYYDRILYMAKQQNLNINMILPETGKISPEVQTLDLTKFNNSFNQKFN
jgi:dTDP-4-dehydrorhamnose reductase